METGESHVCPQSSDRAPILLEPAGSCGCPARLVAAAAFQRQGYPPFRSTSASRPKNFLYKSLFFPTGVGSGGTFPPNLFARALPRQSLFHSPPFTRLQIVRVTFHFSNDVCRLNLPFESTESILQGFALL